MEDKYCRICWNTKNWKEPTGEAAKVEAGGSYVQLNGFGHEEWLFNFEWMLKKSKDTPLCKYGFLQPINKFRNRYVGETFSTLLYTVSPEKPRYFVARIDNCYVPDDEEVNWVVTEMRANGWIDEMVQEAMKVGVMPHIIKNAPPHELVNIRFRQEDVHFFDPGVLIKSDHKTWRLSRYHPLDWDDGYLPPMTREKIVSENTAVLKSEDDRTRAAIEGTTYSPRHDKLQNEVYRYLTNKHGKSKVKYEKEFVDISLQEAEGTTFFEVKVETTVRKCTRAALGQLLEYSHYPSKSKASKLIIISDAIAEIDDHQYLAHLRHLYRLPIYYAQWDWSKKSLTQPI